MSYNIVLTTAEDIVCRFEVYRFRIKVTAKIGAGL